jgi:iron complex outermembrane receptor protein
MVRIVIFLFALNVPYLLGAQNESMDSNILQLVTITSNQWQQDTVRPIDIFQSSAYTLFNRQAPLLALNGENFAQDLRLAVRGFGSRAAFGIRGLRILVDEIPLTSPDGTTNIDELSVYDIHNLEVLTGSRAMNYGNAGGGAIKIYTSPILTNSFAVNARLTNQFSYDIGLKHTLRRRKFSAYHSLQNQKYVGFREHSNAFTTTLYSKYLVDFNDKTKASYIFGSYYSPFGQDSGGLTSEEVIKNPKQANSRNILFDAGESVWGGMFGAHHSFTLSKRLLFTTTSFGKIRNFEGRIPNQSTGWIRLGRLMLGNTIKANYQVSPSITCQIGHQVELQNDHRITSANENGVKGQTKSDVDENLLNNGFFGNVVNNVNRWETRLVGRWDLGKFKINENPFSLSSFNGSIELLYKLTKKSKIFGNFGKSFESPTLNEYSLSNGSLMPEKATHLELGLQLLYPNSNQFSGKVFKIHLSETIIAGEDLSNPGRTLYSNGGIGDRYGFEFFGSYRFSDLISVTPTLEYHMFTIKNSTGQDLKIQPLSPLWKGSLLCDFTYRYVQASLLHIMISPMYLDSENTSQSPWSLDGQLHFTVHHPKLHQWALGFQVGNLYNSLRYSNYRINALNGRYFEPANTRWFSIFMRKSI